MHYGGSCKAHGEMIPYGAAQSNSLQPGLLSPVCYTRNSPPAPVARHVELAALLFLDGIALILAYVGFRLIGSELGLLVPPAGAAAVFTLPSISVLLGFWLVLFVFAGLYRERYAASRFDEFVTVLKVIAVGTILLFFVVFIGRLDAHAARASMLVYGGLVLLFVGGGRLGFRSVQKALIVRGRGVHRAVIVGWSDQVENVYREVQRYPAAGLRVVGAVRLQSEPVAEWTLARARAATADEPAADSERTMVAPNAGGDVAPKFNGEGLAISDHGIASLPELIERLGVQDVLIALGPNDHAYLDEVLRVCDGLADRSGRHVALKLVPDFYAAVGGMARTEHMYGLPLIEVLPVPTPEWERHAKRLIDIVASLFVLTVGLPLWLGIGVAVRSTSPGPAIYKQRRTGEQGKPFVMYKYRTMRDDAERETGPVWACRGDGRVTPLGRALRACRLDEIPQMINVLKGEMSLIGPRPERPAFVERLSREIPLYSRRHRVKPGITGLAQVKWGYDKDIEDVRQKLKYDLMYIEHMSLRMDFQILLQTLRTVFERRGH
jgi:lipopolysaccharide/colanic/teichoic acid biosynthesis glycosyltransferase